MKLDLQLVFSSHSLGNLALAESISVQPPLGLVSIGSYLEGKIKSLKLEILNGMLMDEESLFHRINAPIIGFSVWFSNYTKTIELVKRYKTKNPNATIILGGPYATGQVKNILLNNSEIDYVITGEGEIPFYKFLSGENIERIARIYNKRSVINNLHIIEDHCKDVTDLNDLPLYNLDLLVPKYKWIPSSSGSAMSSFPVSGIRGCPRYKCRCEYCSIPIHGFRTMEPKYYWALINHLSKEYGINYFFETGDAIPSKIIRALSTHKDNIHTNFRIYQYPGNFRSEDIQYLKKMRISTIYIGVESILHWKYKFRRKYNCKYTLQSFLNDIVLLGQNNINVWPGFIIGLPSENKASLKENLGLIQKFASMKNVNEITVSIVQPLPGSTYFSMCIDNNHISQIYQKRQEQELQKDDNINFHLLSKLFVDEFTEAGYKNCMIMLEQLSVQFGNRIANWNSKNLASMRIK